MSPNLFNVLVFAIIYIIGICYVVYMVVKHSGGVEVVGDNSVYDFETLPTYTVTTTTTTYYTNKDFRKHKKLPRKLGTNVN